MSRVARAGATSRKSKLVVVPSFMRTEQEPAAAEVAGLRMRDREREEHGHGRVDGVASALSTSMPTWVACGSAEATGAVVAASDEVVRRRRDEQRAEQNGRRSSEHHAFWPPRPSWTWMPRPLR
jgi:hypothetical protein